VREAGACYNIILSVWDQILPAFWQARDALAACSPDAGGPAMLPEARAFAVVSTLWQYVQAQRGMAQGS
jgi:hypothetical protein